MVKTIRKEVVTNDASFGTIDWFHKDAKFFFQTFVGKIANEIAMERLNEEVIIKEAKEWMMGIEECEMMTLAYIAFYLHTSIEFEALGKKFVNFVRLKDLVECYKERRNILLKNKNLFDFNNKEELASWLREQKELIIFDDNEFNKWLEWEKKIENYRIEIKKKSKL